MSEAKHDALLGMADIAAEDFPVASENGQGGGAMEARRLRGSQVPGSSPGRPTAQMEPDTGRRPGGQS